MNIYIAAFICGLLYKSLFSIIGVHKVPPKSNSVTKGTDRNKSFSWTQNAHSLCARIESYFSSAVVLRKKWME